MTNDFKLNDKVTENFKEIKIRFLVPPLLLLLIGGGYFCYISGSNYFETYINIQKASFFYLNRTLSQLPILQLNLTQLGDVLVSFPLLSIFIICAPKIWEVLLMSTALSGLFSIVLKNIFAIFRPAAIFDNESFTIIGERLTGANSFPSGHSIVIFFIMTTLMYAFFPKKNIIKIIYFLGMLTVGLIIAFSRVGVGAHYPIDVLVGAFVGYVISIISINIVNKLNSLKYIHGRRGQLLLIFIILTWITVLIFKMTSSNLVIFYVSVLSLFITLYLILKSYVQKRN